MSGNGSVRTSKTPLLSGQQIVARLKTVDAEYLKRGDDRRAVAAHELAPNPHRQYTTSDQAVLAAQFFG